MPTKIPKDAFTKAFTKTKLGFQLDKEIGKEEFDWVYDYTPKGADDAWHPSGHCTPSPSELFHYARDYTVLTETPLDGSAPIDKNAPAHEPSLAKIFQVGHFWHQFLQQICLRAGFCEEDAVERRGAEYFETPPQDMDGWTPSPFHWVTGSADICPCEVPGHGPYLIDFKTMGSHQFRANNPHPTTLEKWECQLNVYMDFFGMDRAMIVGINKDAPHDFKEFEFERNQPLIDALYYKWKLVAACLDEDTEPPEDERIDLPLQGMLNG